MDQREPTAKPRIVDQRSEEILQIATQEFCLKSGKDAKKRFELDLYQQFGKCIPGVAGTCDAIEAGKYLRPVLQHIEAAVSGLASGYSATRWLWYLRRLPVFIFSGSLLTTYVYDCALAETADAKVSAKVFHSRTIAYTINLTS
jgi:hypothetical protein